MTDINDLINIPDAPYATPTEEAVAQQVGGTIVSTNVIEEKVNDDSGPSSDSAGSSSDSGSNLPSVETPPAPVIPEPQSMDAILNSLMARTHLVEDTIPPLRMVIYGPAGVGKTVLACAAPGALLYNIEKGDRSLRNHPQLKNVRVMDYVSVYQLEVLISKIAEGVFPGLQDHTGTLVIDSGTELQKRDLDDLVAEATKKDPSRPKYTSTWPEYNQSTEHIRTIFANLRQLPCNVIVIAHEKEVKNDKTGALLLRPWFTKELAGTVNHVFDTVARLTRDDNDVRRLQVHPTTDVAAKTRIGGLSTIIENPRMADIVAANEATPVSE